MIEEIEQVKEVKIPKRVFIVPYRNRVQHKFFFSKYMSFLLEDKDDYEIYFSHQCDTRTFNRGAAKDIGFLAIKQKYPEHYQNITFIFNDVDTIPFNKIFDYETDFGIVKHYYGFKYALGGIVVIKGADFEIINGFPCFWGWGMEDNCLQKRCEQFGLTIDRSLFYNIGSPQILQLFDGMNRIISKKDPWRMEKDNGIDGLRTITNLQFNIDLKSENPNDNIFAVNNERIFFVNIHTFSTYLSFEDDIFYNYDLREPARKIINPRNLKETKKVLTSTDDWNKIPYLPTNREKKEDMVESFISRGQRVPEGLLREIQEDKKNEIKNDVYNKLNDVRNEIVNEQNRFFVAPPQQQRPQIQQRPVQQQQRQQMQQRPQQMQQQQQQQPRSAANIYSAEYARSIGVKPRAQASAKIRLGGIF